MILGSTVVSPHPVPIKLLATLPSQQKQCNIIEKVTQDYKSYRPKINSCKDKKIIGSTEVRLFTDKRTKQN